jgi:hypothetical protein
MAQPISFFADQNDVAILLDRLNSDTEIAFIVPDGPLDPEAVYANRLGAIAQGKQGDVCVALVSGMVDDGYRQRWKAVKTVEALKDGQHSLWHIPGGPLPLLDRHGSTRPIHDPWGGWTEERPGANPTAPYFGPAHPTEIRLDLWTRHRPYSAAERTAIPVLYSYWDSDQDRLVVSDFQWASGRYGPSPSLTKRWWNRLKAWFRRTTTPLGSGREVFWAFPSALRKLKGGMAYYCRGWDLSESIRLAEP